MPAMMGSFNSKALSKESLLQGAGNIRWVTLLVNEIMAEIMAERNDMELRSTTGRFIPRGRDLMGCFQRGESFALFLKNFSLENKIVLK